MFSADSMLQAERATALVGNPNPSNESASSERGPATLRAARAVQTLPANVTTANLVTRAVQVLANLLLLIDLALLMLNVALVFYELPLDHAHRVEMLDNAMEDVTLAFTFMYHFGLLSLEHGWQRLVHDEWVELLFHIIFATHEYPFMVLKSVTGGSWEYVQGLCMRITLIPCIWMTIGDHRYHPQLPSARRLSQARSNRKSLKGIPRNLASIVDSSDVLRMPEASQTNH
ncbi:unnamed protein product [Phytophthora lilii]|uniref:Unnamed protein product n=1 Tax=Phytophthora lilii TaxID=2077276 RepID=A0A9W6XG80_9STRA|nr:unnamed protein product [Phytophthora lilii]